MEQEEFIQKIQQHGSTLEDVITKIMDIITAFDIYEDYYYWPLIGHRGIWKLITNMIQNIWIIVIL